MNDASNQNFTPASATAEIAAAWPPPPALKEIRCPRGLRDLAIWLGHRGGVPHYTSTGVACLAGAPPEYRRLQAFVVSRHDAVVGSYDGIMFVLPPSSGFSVITIEGCAIGGTVDQRVMRVIGNTYAAPMPNGTDLQIIVRGELPARKFRHPSGFHIEVCAKGRFHHLTGQTNQGALADVAEPTPELLAFLEEPEPEPAAACGDREDDRQDDHGRAVRDVDRDGRPEHGDAAIQGQPPISEDPLQASLAGAPAHATNAERKRKAKATTGGTHGKGAHTSQSSASATPDQDAAADHGQPQADARPDVWSDQPPSDAEVIECAIAKAKEADDSGAVFAADVVAALGRLRQSDLSGFMTTRARIKKANRDILIRELDRAVYGAGGGGANDEQESTADKLVALVRSKVELFHSPDRTAYASFLNGDHREVWPIASTGFREWMAHQYYREHESAPAEAGIGAALLTLTGQAKFDGQEIPVCLRCAKLSDGYLIDLGDDRWRAIEVTGVGWRIVDAPAVHFWRNDSTRSLPVPAMQGDLSKLWKYVNVPEEDRHVVLAWMLECWRPDTPFVVLEIVGEQGAAKSYTQKILRALIDANTVPLRAAPKSVEDLCVSARNGWLCSLNNLSRLPAPIQDALCCLATGGGFATRTFYTNQDETAFDIKRPVIINGIGSLATAQDLADRVVNVAPLPIKEYVTEAQMNAEFAEDAPAIMAGLLDLFVVTLCKLPAVKLSRPPRMADFTRLGEAMMQAQGRVPGVFTTLYSGKRKEAALRALEASPVACAVQAFVKTHPGGEWNGTTGALLGVLACHRPQGEAWPLTARGLGDALRRGAPGLRAAGVEVSFDPVRRNDGYHVSLKPQRERGREENRTPAKDVHDVHDVHRESGNGSSGAQPGERREHGEHCPTPSDTPHDTHMPPSEDVQERKEGVGSLPMEGEL